MEVNDLKRMQNYFQGWGMQYTMGEIPSYVYEFFKKGIESGESYYGLNHTTTRSVAGFANATYSYDGRYTVNGTFRYEGTNRMGKAVLPAGFLHGICQEHGMYMKKISSRHSALYCHT